MSDTIASIVEGIQQILRYVAPGFVSLGLVILQFPELMNKADSIFRAEPGTAVLAGLTMGVVLNSVHTALLENWLCILVCWIFKYKYVNDVPQSLKNQSARKMMMDLEKQRMLRRNSEIVPVQGVQRDHDALGATLTFLYCASYPGFLIPLIPLYQGWTGSITGASIHWIVPVIGALFLVAAFLCDFRYTRQDTWVARNFPQKHKA